jgi:hypothetical protein
MPNQRKKGKVLVGGFFDKATKAQFKAEAKRRNMTVSQLMIHLLELAAKDADRKD